MSKNILITGASAGLGKSTATAFLQKGYTVYGTSRNIDKQSNADGIIWLNLDLAQSDSVEKLAEYFTGNNIALHALINNAGTGMVASVIDTPRHAWQQIFETNLFGPLQLISLLYPQLKNAKNGCIINIGSVAAEFGLPYRGAYSAVKSALGIASESLALELKNNKIKVHLVQPGDFATNINNNRIVVNNVHPDFAKDHESIHQLINSHVSDGMSPEVMANYLLGLVENPRNKFKHTVAPFIQKASVFLKHNIPFSSFQKLLINHYKLKK